MNGLIQPRFRTIDGLAVRFAASEERDDHALLLSPWPESLYAFEPTWLRLAEHAHLVAIDLPGFGHSQRSDADVEPEGIAAVVNGLALCAIHHLAFDRNLLGIDPTGVVHIADRLLREIDGPMLKTGLQGFHGAPIALPHRPEDRPNPARLETRFERFVRAPA